MWRGEGRRPFSDRPAQGGREKAALSRFVREMNAPHRCPKGGGGNTSAEPSSAPTCWSGVGGVRGLPGESPDARGGGGPLFPLFAPGPPHSIIPSSFLSFPIGSSFPFFTRSNSPLSLRFFPRRRRRICVVAAPSQTQRLQLFGREDFLCVSDVGEGGEQEQQKRLAPRGLGKANIWKGSSPLSSFLSRRESGERKKGFQMEGGGEGGVNRHRRRLRRPPISQALNPFFFFFSFLPPRKIWKNGKGNLLLAVTLPSPFYSTIYTASIFPALS